MYRYECHYKCIWETREQFTSMSPLTPHLFITKQVIGFISLSGHFMRGQICLVFGNTIKRNHRTESRDWRRTPFSDVTVIPKLFVWSRMPDARFLYWLNYLRSWRVQSTEGAKRRLSILFIDEQQCFYRFFAWAFLKVMCTERMARLWSMALCIKKLYSLIMAASIS